MEPIVYGLSNEQYHRGEEERQYLSSSQLKWYLKSPRYAKFMLDALTYGDAQAAQNNKAIADIMEGKSDALRFGSLFHDLMESLAIANGDWSKGYGGWKDGIAIFDPPKNDKTGQPYGNTTKAYSAVYEAFLQANEDKLIASQTEIDTVKAMAQSLMFDSGATSEQVRKLLKWAKATEVSYFYETEDGIKLKVRPDLLTRDKIVDWKTCSLDSLDEDSIARQIIKYRYDVSLSMYQYVIHAIEGRWLTPILVFVQKLEPFDAIMCDISEWCYTYDPYDDFVKPGIGALEFRKLLDLHTECAKNNEWPGAESSIEADGNTRIMKPAVPYWLGMKYFEI